MIINGREYALPSKKTVAICVDGFDPAYVDPALPCAFVDAAMPTFTNPNNVSIITGVPPSVHGISGNHFYDREQKKDVPMNARAYLRCPTILETFAAQGVRVLAVTAKEKLLAFVSPGEASANSAAFSAEKPGALGLELAGRAPGDIYSADASLWVLDAGLAAIERDRFDLVYLSTTDYVQHKHAPGSAEAIAFHRALLDRVERFDALGARVGFTADHGMNEKPRILYLRPVLPKGAHITLPITDPYVVHHGALGGCAMIHLDPRDEPEARRVLSDLDGVDRVLSREAAARELELPVDRIGDLVVLAARDTALGKSEAEHDLSHLGGSLRSHGSTFEQRVPLFTNVRRAQGSSDSLIARRNFDLFALLLIS